MCVLCMNMNFDDNKLQVFGDLLGIRSLLGFISIATYLTRGLGIFKRIDNKYING